VVRLLLLLAILFDVATVRLAVADEILVIANASVQISTPMTLRQIAAIYLLRMTSWPDGGQIVPVNRELASDIRARFAGMVLKQDNASLAAYWNEMHFQGKLPPLVQESEAAMLAFVQRVPGAVGYISATTIPSDVKVIARVP
jgi:ABC-type phosphate transport system substrate-binding protein